MSFLETIESARAFLERNGRLSLRVLKREFELDDEALDELVEELVDVQQVAARVGKVLSWIGSAPADTSATDPGAHTGAAAPPEPVAAPDAAEAERRQLTVMFCDLVGWTELSEALDAEDLREVVRGYQQACSEAIEPFEGSIAQYLGDGLLVYFGYPQAHEDDAARALHAALALLDALPGMNARIRERVPALASPVEVRIGVHTGRVVAGEIGAGEKRERLAIGDTVNLAARLQGVAGPDQVVISDATRSLVEGRFEFDQLGPQTLKGIESPVPAFRLLRPTGVRSRLELAGPTGLTPLVGREQDVALLLDRWEQVSEGHGQVVLLSGDAGIGKSRLVQILHERLAGEPHSWLEASGSAYHQNSALYTVIELLEQGLLVTGEDSAEEKIAKLEAALGRTGFSVPEVVSLFASLLSVSLPERYPPLQLSPKAQRQRTLESLVAWLFSLSGAQPLVLVVEDLHWIDPSTLELLGMLLEQVPTVPVLLLLTFRPDFEPPWASRSHLVHLPLHPLTRKQIEAMVERIAGGKALPAVVLEQLVTRTDGVPLFVEELTKTVLESDLLRESDQGCERTDSLPELAIPSTLQDSLMARLDRLGPAKEVAQVGAVLGRDFPYALLAAVASCDDDELRDRLARLEAAELVFRQGIAPRATYTFKHAFVQLAAYESLLRSRRRELHERTARVLEQDFPDQCERQPELLAHHFGEARLAEPAVDYYQRAGDRALERSASAEAVAHLTRGLEVLERLPQTRERGRRELRLQLALGVSLPSTQGLDAPEVEQAFLRARELCREAGEVRELFPALWGLWFHKHQGRSDYVTAQRLAEQLLRLAETTREPDLLLEAHHAGWTTQHMLGDLRAAYEHTRAGLAIYRREEHHALAQHFGNHDPGECSLGIGASVLALLGYPEQSTKRTGESVALAESLGHPRPASPPTTARSWSR